MAWYELYSEDALATGTHWSKRVRLRDGLTDHAFEFVVGGSGTVTITPYVSISGQHFVSSGTKVSAVGNDAGPDADGKNNVPISLKPAEFIMFKVVVAAASVDFSLWFTQK